MIRGLAPRPGGGWIVVGAFKNTIDLGGGPRTSRGGFDGFVVALGARGEYLWDHVLGGTGEDLPGDVAVSADGQVVVTGGATGAIDLGGGTRRNAGGADVIIVSLSSQGRYQWDLVLGEAGYDFGRGVAFARDGSIAIAGHYGDGTMFGATKSASTDANANVDAFVLLLEPDGRKRWARTIESTGWAGMGAVAVTGDTIVAVGRIQGDALIDGKVQRYGGMAALAAAYTTAGTRSWLRTLGGPGSEVATDVAATAQGEIVVVGYAADSPPTGFAHGLDASGRTRWSEQMKPLMAWVTVRSDGAIFAGDSDAHGTVVLERTAADQSGELACGGFFMRGPNHDLFVFSTDAPTGPRSWPSILGIGQQDARPPSIAR